MSESGRRRRPLAREHQEGLSPFARRLAGQQTSQARAPRTGPQTVTRVNITGSPVAHDASVMTFTPAVLADWDAAADPGDVDDALDQLAERTTDLEAAPPAHVHDASVITYTPAVPADWDGGADPGNQDDANDQLAERTADLELAPPAHGSGYHSGTIGYIRVPIATLSISGTMPAIGNNVHDFMVEAPADGTIETLRATMKTAPTADTTFRVMRAGVQVSTVTVLNGATEGITSALSVATTAGDNFTLDITAGNASGTNAVVRAIAKVAVTAT